MKLNIKTSTRIIPLESLLELTIYIYLNGRLIYNKSKMTKNTSVKKAKQIYDMLLHFSASLNIFMTTQSV